MEVKVAEPKTAEQVAMGKVIDPFSEPYPLWHATFIKRLPNILTQGLISQDFAVRSGMKNFRPMHGSSWNKTYVSLMRGKAGWQPLENAEEVQLIIDPLLPGLIPANSGHAQYRDIKKPLPGEILVRNRVAPREIKGVWVRYNSEWPGEQERNIQAVVGVMQSIDPQFSVPIYTGAGIVWPQTVSREQLQDGSSAK